MLAIAGGLGASVAFAAAALCNARSSRMIGAWSLLAWVALVGLAVAGPAAAVAGIPAGVPSGAWAWLAVAGVGNVLGLLAAYSALRRGQVGLIAPIVSTEGAVAAAVAALAGEPIGVLAGLLLVVMVLGVVTAGASARSEAPAAGPDRAPGLGVALAVVAAGAFGASLYATARAGTELSLAWVLLAPRAIGVTVVLVPLLLLGRLQLTGAALPLVVASGLAEVVGFVCFTVGAQHGIAVTSVLTSQFGAVAAIAAFVLFGERLGRIQVGAIATIVVAVGALAAVQA